MALANAESIAHKPKNLSHVEAAALPLVGVSAWQALVENIGLIMHIVENMRTLIKDSLCMKWLNVQKGREVFSICKTMKRF